MACTPKVSARKLRYFAHDPGRPVDCAWLNESLEHHLLKLALATAVRAADWHAELEVRATDGTWRAHVLASSHDGARCVAWEAQLSPITSEDIQERTERYRADGIGVCWVSPAEQAPWMGHVSSIRVREPRDGQPWTVVDGPAVFDFDHGTWITVDNLELTAFVHWALHGQTVVHGIRHRYRRVWFGADESNRRRHLIWTTTPHIGTRIVILGNGDACSINVAVWGDASKSACTPAGGSFATVFGTSAVRLAAVGAVPVDP